MMQSNEIIRAKKTIHELVNNQVFLIVTTGVICETLYIMFAFLTLNLTHSIISPVSIIGMVVVVLGIVFKMKEYESETGEKTYWLHNEGLNPDECEIKHE